MPNKDVILYLDGSNPPPVVVVTEADTAWTFRFTVMYQNAIYAPNVANVVLAGHKPDGNAFAFLGSKSGNVFTVGCNVQMTAVPGDVLAALHLLGGGNTAIPFILRVQPGAAGTDPVASASALPAYTTILNRIGNFPPNLAQYVSNWLAENISGGETIAVDKTFSVEGAAAEATATGAALAAIRNNLASEYDPSLYYQAGAYVVQNNKLYRALAEIEPEAWTEAHWIRVSLAECVSELEHAQIETDTTLTVEGAAADAKAAGDALKQKITMPSGGKSGQSLFSDGEGNVYWDDFQVTGSGLTEEVKQALLDCFEHVAWINDQGQTYFEALHTALYPPADLVNIAAVYTQSAVVTESTELDALKSDLVVTATYSDATRREISNYTLYGTLTSGESFITVAYGGKTTRFSVTVTGGVLYALPQSESFNGQTGAKSIDTGLQLMATDRSFTIMFSAVTGNGAIGGSPIFHCLTESAPYPGLSFQRNGDAYAIGGFQSGNIGVGCSSVAGIPIKAVIRHEEGSQYCYADTTNNGVRNEQVVLNNNGTFRASDKTMILGSYQTATGEKGRFWAGTISEFTVISGVISDAAVDNYLGEEA